MSKKIGARDISVDQIVTIVKMSSGEGCFRSTIAETVCLSENTVYRWQKRFDLI